MFNCLLLYCNSRTSFVRASCGWLVTAMCEARALLVTQTEAWLELKKRGNELLLDLMDVFSAACLFIGPEP